MTEKHTRKVIMEVILVILFLGILFYLLQEHAPKILKLLESGNAEEIDEYLMKYGTEGKLLLVLLQVIETVSIVLPAVPVYICSGIMFGKLAGVLVCYGVNLILNLLIFLTAQKMKSAAGGQRFDINNQKFIGRLVQNAKHMDRVVLAMCLLPIVPNGMIPYLSAQTKVTTGEFMKALAIGSLPSIILYVCCGDMLMSAHYKITAPIVIVLVVLAALVFAFRKKLIAVLEPKVVKFIEG